MSAMRWALCVALALSMLFASTILWIALSENSQEEFYGSEFGTQWVYIFTLWFAAFFWAFIGPAVVLITVKLFQLAKRKWAERPNP